MSKVSGDLFTLIRKQVENRGMIVCYDPQKDYSNAFYSLSSLAPGIWSFSPCPYFVLLLFSSRLVNF